MLGRTVVAASRCGGAPTISVLTSSIVVQTCAGGGTLRRGQVTLSGALTDGQKLKWEIARDSAGTAWADLEVSTNTTVDDQFQVPGDDDPAAWGSDQIITGAIFYARHRVTVVDVLGRACGAATTSTQASDDTMTACI